MGTWGSSFPAVQEQRDSKPITALLGASSLDGQHGKEVSQLHETMPAPKAEQGWF